MRLRSALAIAAVVPLSLVGCGSDDVDETPEPTEVPADVDTLPEGDFVDPDLVDDDEGDDIDDGPDEGPPVGD